MLYAKIGIKFTAKMHNQSQIGKDNLIKAAVLRSFIYFFDIHDNKVVFYWSSSVSLFFQSLHITKIQWLKQINKEFNMCTKRATLCS